MACSNCFNGCTEIISDQCVRYTGNDIPALEIENGDSLAEVELKITNFILSLSTCENVIPVINPADLCALVSGFLPGTGDINLNDVLSALIQSVCSLKASVTAIESTLNTLNADYTIGCLTGVTSSSDTHDILQAAITKLCATDAALTAFILDVTTNYVQLANLNQLIQDYLDSIAPTSLQKNKMVPYVVYEYYGPITDFDITGAGSGQWIDVYLCNGNNGTPDKRGRVAVGVTTGMGGGAMNSAVDPAISGNPNYTLGSTVGNNTVALTVNQIPSHTHTATVTVVDPGHTHTLAYKKGQADQNESGVYGELLDMTLPKNLTTVTNSSTTGVTVSVANSQTGGNLGHANVQPGIGAYFIQYRP